MAQPGPNFGRIRLAHRVGPILPPLMVGQPSTSMAAAMKGKNMKEQVVFSGTSNEAELWGPVHGLNVTIEFLCLARNSLSETVPFFFK